MKERHRLKKHTITTKIKDFVIFQNTSYKTYLYEVCGKAELYYLFHGGFQDFYAALKPYWSVLVSLQKNAKKLIEKWYVEPKLSPLRCVTDAL